MALILSAIFFAVTGYYYGWDDQHLEIPLLKSLIDPTLYAGDYYIESLQKNFSSYFYPLLAKIIRVDQIPATYFCLYIVSRYFLFYWIYKLWLYLSQDKFKAFCCVLIFFLVTRVHEFLYRTFSHQEFALAIIFAGIYYFFKERFFLSSLLLGIAANIHALYSLFPFLFLELYLLTNIKKHGFKKLFASGVIFTITSLPFLLWTLKNRMEGTDPLTGLPAERWLSLFITACPQNFFYPQFPTIPFNKLFSSWQIFYYANESYLFLIGLFLLNVFFNPLFRNNKKAVVFCSGAFLLLGLCLIFTYIHPQRLFIDLNLSRNTQFLLFLLMGFTGLYVIDKIENQSILVAFIYGILFSLLKYNTSIGIASIGLMIGVEQCLTGNRSPLKTKLLYYASGAALILPCLYTVVFTFHGSQYQFFIRLFILVLFGLLILQLGISSISLQKTNVWQRRMFIIIPLLIFFAQFSYYHSIKHKEETQGEGFWRLQRSWEDMQRFVRDHTPRDAMVLVPHDMEMGGFRIQSERKEVASYRDCGIIGFDFKAAQEWQRRISAIEPFRIKISRPFDRAIKNAIVLYDANYIVFLRYAAPKNNTALLQKMYTNSDFSLYKVTR